MTDANVGDFLDWVMNRQAAAFGGGAMAADDAGGGRRGGAAAATAAAAAADEDEVGGYASPDYSYSGSEDEEEDGDEGVAEGALDGSDGGSDVMVLDGDSGEGPGPLMGCKLSDPGWLHQALQSVLQCLLSLGEKSGSTPQPCTQLCRTTSQVCALTSMLALC